MTCPYPRFVWPKGKIIGVPCGKCLFCLQNRRNDWTARLMQEYKVSSSAHFVTLTYHPKYLPDRGVTKRHLQLFIKRLRKESQNRLRYYAVGEYGSRTGRAHYHLILFNLEDPEFIRGVWRHPDTKQELGIVHIGKVTEASCAYVTKYVIQRHDHSDKSLNPPFCLMSRGYGLGAHYLTDKMVQWHRCDDRNYMMDCAIKKRLPRFYKEKIWPSSEWSNWKWRREQVGEKSFLAGQLAEKENIRLLRIAGYDSSDKIAKVRKEMRDAVESRIMQKTAYTQTL